MRPCLMNTKPAKEGSCIPTVCQVYIQINIWIKQTTASMNY